MPKNLEHGNRTRSRTGASVEHPCAEQRDHMGLFIRTIGRSRPRQGQNRYGQSCLQSETFCLVAGAECARMRNEAMLSLGKSSNDLSGDNNFTRQNRTATNAETRLGTLADITERHVAAPSAAKALRGADREGEGLKTELTK